MGGKGSGRLRKYPTPVEARLAKNAQARAAWREKHGPPRPRGSWSRKYATPEEKAAAKRQRALTAYHAKRDQINARRAFFSACRRVLVDPRSDEAVNREALAMAARRVVDKWNRRNGSAVYAKLVRRLRCYFEKAVWSGSRSKRVRELLGCTVEELRTHLEKRFQPGMTWENHGFSGWHIDHIRPLASFDLSDPGQQRLAFHYSNLQPLWAEDNFKKRDKFAPDNGGPVW